MAQEIYDSTPHVGENLLGLTTPEQINEAEAKGVIEGEKFIINLDENIRISASLLLQVNKISFGNIYAWAGKWRDQSVQVDTFLPPEPAQIPNLIYQFTDELNHKIDNSVTIDSQVTTLAYCHHKLVFIHPFNNTNGRTSRLFTNLVAYKFGYADINLYFRTGEKRKIYIEAIRKADAYDYALLEDLIKKELTLFGTDNRKID
jgi:cell filamentation protein